MIKTIWLRANENNRRESINLDESHLKHLENNDRNRPPHFAGIFENGLKKRVEDNQVGFVLQYVYEFYE